jgi:hypothetical protein
MGTPREQMGMGTGQGPNFNKAPGRNMESFLASLETPMAKAIMEKILSVDPATLDDLESLNPTMTSQDQETHFLQTSRKNLELKRQICSAFMIYPSLVADYVVNSAGYLSVGTTKTPKEIEGYLREKQNLFSESNLEKFGVPAEHLYVVMLNEAIAYIKKNKKRLGLSDSQEEGVILTLRTSPYLTELLKHKSIRETFLTWAEMVVGGKVASKDGTLRQKQVEGWAASLRKVLRNSLGEVRPDAQRGQLKYLEYLLDHTKGAIGTPEANAFLKEILQEVAVPLKKE